MTDGRIIIDTYLDSKGLGSGLKNLGDVANSCLKVFTGVIVASGRGLTGLGVNAIDLASDLTDVQSSKR